MPRNPFLSARLQLNCRVACAHPNEPSWIDPASHLLEYNRPVRRRFVIALAFLSVALTGGTCEFRAVSNNPIPDEPPEGESNNPDTGLLILVNAGSSNSITDTATIDASIIQTALATSVLSVPSHYLIDAPFGLLLAVGVIYFANRVCAEPVPARADAAV